MTMAFIKPVFIIIFLTLVGIQARAVAEISEPAYPLYAIASGNPEPTQEDLEVLARGFTLVHGDFTRDEIEYIHQINPDFKVLNYVNSSYTTKPEQVPLVEGEFRNALLQFPAAELAEDLGLDATHFRLKPTALSDYDSIALKGSTRTGKLSSGDPEFPSTQHYVTWIGIGGEWMRIEAFDESTNQIQVTRGFAGTRPQFHKAGNLVFCPAYLGSQNLAGAYPGGPGPKLRYGFDPAKPDAGRWIAGLAKGVMNRGFDGVWLDIMSASAFNLADSSGRLVRPWNFHKDRFYEPAEFRRGQELKVNGIQNDVYRTMGRWPVLVANNMQARHFEEVDGGLKWLLQSTDIKKRPLDGYCIEGFAGGFFAIPAENRVSGLEYHTGDLWRENVKMVMKCAQQHLAAYPMASKAGSKSLLIEPWSKERDDFEAYAYASYLLAVEPDFATPLGLPVFYQRNGKRFAYLHPRYTWPIGAPEETVSPDRFEEYRVEGHQSYRRHFENGIVLVNPTDQDDGIVKLSQKYKNPLTGKSLQSIKMTPHTGVVLLKD